MEYKSALDYIHSDKYKKFHKERKEGEAKSKALEAKKGTKKERHLSTLSRIAEGNEKYAREMKEKHGIA